MIEAVLRTHATDHEHSEARSGSTACSDDDTGGVALGRLLAIATLTPAQAALLVTDVVDRLELAHGRGRPPIRLRIHDVMVSDAGHLVIRDAGDAGSWDAVRNAAAGLLHRIVTNCRSEALTDRLDVAIAESSDLVGLARRVRYAAATEFDESEIGRKRSQLAALVAAVKGRARTEDAATEQVDVPIPAPRPRASNHLHPFAGKVWHRKRRRPSRRRWILALLAVLLLVGMVWAAPTAWSELSRAWNTLLDPAESSMDDRISPVSPPAEPGAEPSPIETALPGAAGPITQVAATFANGPCEPGEACTVRVDVGLDPAANVGAVTWNPTVYDRCTGATLPGREITIPVPPGVREAYGIGSVDLPPGSALAVAAVTTAPAATASEPVSVPSENATCSPGSPRDGG